MRPVLKWLTALGLGVWGLSALSGHLPPRLRLLLLFSMAFGMLAGWSAGVLADEFGVRRTRWAAGATFVLAVAGLVNQTWTAYREAEGVARRIRQQDPQQLLALRILESTMTEDPALQQRYLEERARLQPTYTDYLASRWSRVGWLPTPWPAVIWFGETLLGGMAAILLFRRRSNVTRSPTSPPV